MSSTVEQVKARLSIVDVVGGYVKLEKAGVNYKGRCPFHNEKSPSFFVSPGRESYHCFGCAKGGDILSFIQEIEGLDFIGALKMLAERAGVEMETRERTTPQEKSEREAILHVLRDAALLFQSALKKNKTAQEYVKGRGINENIIAQFEVGYAPDGWRVLLEELKRRGHQEGIIEKAGLAIRSAKGPLYDRFRNRIMFPLKDAAGTVVGFSGRTLESAASETTDGSAPKYMNSPETPVFQKSRVLFGIEKAKMAIRKNDRAVLVEGQMDLVLSHQAGVTEAVGVSGTALTEEHLTAIGRLSKNLIMAFDADSAGISASKRALNMALGLGMEVRIALLPDGLDPADLVRTDPEEWRRRVGSARHVIDFFIDLLERIPDDAGRRRMTEETILPYVKLLRSPLDQGHFAAKIARVLGQSEQTVWEAIARAVVPAQNVGATTVQIPQMTPLAPRRTRVLEQLYGIILWQEGIGADVQTHRTRLVALLGLDTFATLEKELASKKGELTLEAEVAHEGSKEIGSVIDKMLSTVEEELLQMRFREILVALREAEKKGDQESLTRHLADCQAITSRITALTQQRLGN